MHDPLPTAVFLILLYAAGALHFHFQRSTMIYGSLVDVNGRVVWRGKIKSGEPNRVPDPCERGRLGGEGLLTKLKELALGGFCYHCGWHRDHHPAFIEVNGPPSEERP